MGRGSWVDICPMTFIKGFTSVSDALMQLCQHLLNCWFFVTLLEQGPCPIRVGFRDTVPSGRLRKSSQQQSCSNSLIQEEGGHVTAPTKKGSWHRSKHCHLSPKDMNCNMSTDVYFQVGHWNTFLSGLEDAQTLIVKIWFSSFPGGISSKTMKQHSKDLRGVPVQPYSAFLL